MAVALRLFRLGKKNKPSYRVIAVERRSKRNGRYIEAVGHYHPLKEPFELELNKERFDYWVSRGAIISDGLQRLLKTRHIKKD